MLECTEVKEFQGEAGLGWLLTVHRTLGVWRLNSLHVLVRCGWTGGAPLGQNTHREQDEDVQRAAEPTEPARGGASVSPSGGWDATGPRTASQGHFQFSASDTLEIVTETALSSIAGDARVYFNLFL